MIIESLQDEVWLPIKGFDGLYEISTKQRILSHTKGVTKLIKGHKNGGGYLQLYLWKDGERYMPKLHRVIAEAFIPNPENKPIINHINGIKDDNRIENLEWCTSGENQSHSFRVLNRVHPRTGLHGKDNPQSKKIRCVDNGMLFDSMKEAAKHFNLNVGNISNVCTGNYRQKRTGGLKFEFAWIHQ